MPSTEPPVCLAIVSRWKFFLQSHKFDKMGSWGRQIVTPGKTTGSAYGGQLSEIKRIVQMIDLARFLLIYRRMTRSPYRQSVKRYHRWQA